MPVAGFGRAIKACYPNHREGRAVPSFEDSPEYYRMCEAQERSAADAARVEEIKKIHLSLAEKYAVLAAKAASKR
jgi:hypothetical protein